MILLDTDHLSVYKYADSERAGRLQARLREQPTDEVVAISIITVEEQMRHVLRTCGGVGQDARNRTLIAPLPGKISRVAVEPGATVNAGDTLLVIEAMKMENEFKAAAAGIVAEVRVAPGQAVNAGDVLIVMA